MNINVRVNGKTYTRDVEPRLLLVDFIRDHLGMTGTNIGCDTTQCGACTIHLNGKAVKSCTVLAVQADEAELTTIEGIGKPSDLHPMQAAFQDNHGLQCGFCTPGMIMAAIKLVEERGEMNDDEVRHGLEGNLCRCTGYENIVKSVQAAANDMGVPHSPFEADPAAHHETLREAEARAAARSHE